MGTPLVIKHYNTAVHLKNGIVIVSQMITSLTIWMYILTRNRILIYLMPTFVEYKVRMRSMEIFCFELQVDADERDVGRMIQRHLKLLNIGTVGEDEH